MDHLHLRYFLVVGASITFILLCVSALLLSQAQKQAERRDKRLASVVDAHQRVTLIEMSAFGDKLEIERPALVLDDYAVPVPDVKWWPGLSVSVAGIMGTLIVFVGAVALAIATRRTMATVPVADSSHVG